MRKLLTLIPLGLTIACTDSVRSKRQDLSVAADSSHIKPAGAPTRDSVQKESFGKVQPGVITSSEDFASFWNAFRWAIHHNDTTGVMQLTRFPFQTRGESDSDPVIEYAEADFPRVLEVYLQQREYTSLEEEQLEFELISNTQHPATVPATENWTRIGDLQFEKINGKWKLVFAYLTRESREKLTVNR